MTGGKSVQERIVEESWRLFNEKGFDNTTIDNIIEAAGVAKGTFYYHFKSKDEMLDTLSILLDEKYREVEKQVSDDMDAVDKLLFYNHKIHGFMGDNINYGIIAHTYAAQLTKEDSGKLLDRNRYYYKLVTKTVIEGQKAGEIRTDLLVEDIVDDYAMFERAMLNDWCMHNGEYDLGEFSYDHMKRWLEIYRTK